MNFALIAGFFLGMPFLCNAEVRIYSKEGQFTEKMKIILDKHKIDARGVESIDVRDCEHLYIIDDIFNIDENNLPKYFIGRQSRVLNPVIVSNEMIKKMSKAVAIWDYDWKNIGCYDKAVFNYFYFPFDYEFVDPVILPCTLPVGALDAYKEMLVYSNQKNTDISSHLPTLFSFAFMRNPRTILEAGVRDGESTIALAKAAKLCQAKLIGLDIDGISGKVYSRLENAVFFCMNDLDFPGFYKNNEKPDVIFIDTSHMYAQTLAELKVFVPLLSDNGLLIFHDSNVTPLAGAGYKRINNTASYGAFGNTRGVTQALKEYFNLSFDEAKYNNFSFFKDEISWKMIHYPFCNGLTILQKGKKIARTASV